MTATAVCLQWKSRLHPGCLYHSCLRWKRSLLQAGWTDVGLGTNRGLRRLKKPGENMDQIPVRDQAL